VKISETAQSWVTMLTNVGVLAGLLLLVMELNQNAQQLELQLQFSANQKYFESNRDMMDPQTALVFAKAITAPKELSFAEGLIASSWVLNSLNAGEDKYWIYRAGLVTEQEWKEELRANLPWVLGSPFAKLTWETTKSEYEKEYADFIDSELQHIPDDVTWRWWLDFQSGLPEATGQN